MAHMAPMAPIVLMVPMAPVVPMAAVAAFRCILNQQSEVYINTFLALDSFCLMFGFLDP